MDVMKIMRYIASWRHDFLEVPQNYANMRLSAYDSVLPEDRSCSGPTDRRKKQIMKEPVIVIDASKAF